MLMAELINFQTKLKEIQGLMGLVAESPDKLKEKESEYQELRRSLKKYFDLYKIPDPSFSSLEQFRGYWKSSLPPHWKDRRDFIKKMYGEIEKAVESALNEGGPLKLQTLQKLEKVTIRCYRATKISTLIEESNDIFYEKKKAKLFNENEHRVFEELYRPCNDARANSTSTLNLVLIR